MGARLIAEVLANFNDVGYDAYRLLVRMAHTALDEDTKDRPARLYFGGRDVLAETIRDDLPAEPTSKERKNAYADVRRALRVLVEAGAVERANSAHTGERQVYRLTLKRNPDFAPTRRGGKRKKGGALHPQEEGHTAPPEEGRTAPPVEKEEGITAPLEEGRTAPPKEPLRNHLDLEERFQETCEEGLLPPTGSAHAPVSSEPDSSVESDPYEVASRRLARVPQHQERLFQAAIDALGRSASTTELAIYAAGLLDPQKVPAG